MVPNELLEADIEHEVSQTDMSQLTKAILMTVLYVAKEILPQNAVLLPEASDMFIEAFLLPGASSSDLLLDQQMLDAYVHKHSLFPLTECIRSILLKIDISSTKILEQVDSLLLISEDNQNFQSFITECCKGDDTWKFWAQFVFKDCLAYIGLYLAVRNHNWKLRVAYLKEMTPFFCSI